MSVPHFTLSKHRQLPTRLLEQLSGWRREGTKVSALAPNLSAERVTAMKTGAIQADVEVLTERRKVALSSALTPLLAQHS